MPKISVVIVSYNVKYFLRQCIQSVLNTKVNAELEIIVVDNASSDGSADMVRKKFPQLICLSNNENLGFSKANNQGFKIATGDFILILNPDTIIEENTLATCLTYLLDNTGVAAVGVRMVDGTGNYLPESKRGFPSPLNSLFKISGLSSLLTSSKLFNGYYLGHLDEFETSEMDVLSGAFIFIEKHTLDRISGFDEDYFMYGEDIELSYQIKSLGKKIVYLPTSTIIHFKGESTKKSSLNYLRRFYGAMQIYSSKRHSTGSWIWNLILNIGILFVGISGLFKSIFTKILLPLISVLALFGLTKVLQKFWAIYHFKDASYYQNANNEITIWLLCLAIVAIYYFWGHFDRQYSIRQWIYAAVSSILLLLSMYGLFPMEWRFSRLILLVLLFLSPVVLFLFRTIANKFRINEWSFLGELDKRIFVIGSESSFNKVNSILEYFYRKISHLQKIDIEENPGIIEDKNQFANVVQLYEINEIIFCTRDIATESIFKLIAFLDKNISFKIANNDNTSILGSSSRNTLGEWYTLDFDFKIKKEFHKRTKRIIDLLFCFILILVFPVILILKTGKLARVYSKLIKVLFGQMTWISYSLEDEKIESLPILKKGVFAFQMFNIENEPNQYHKWNVYYAQNYNIWMEFEQIIRHIWAL